MKKYNMTFVCQKGRFNLKECNYWPSEKAIQDALNDLESKSIGLGKTKKIIIEPIY